MKKIPRLFVPDPKDPAHCLREVHPDAQWVAEGEGVATRKFDGTATMVRDGKLYARYDAKRGKVPPPGSIPCDPEADPVTGHWPHWVEVKDQPQYKWHLIAWKDVGGALPDGTYELCGPKLQTNAEGLGVHWFIPHGKAPLNDCPRDYDGLVEYLRPLDIEGIVFHKSDGRMVKITKGHLGLPRK